MTELLEKAFAEAAKLPASEQDQLAKWLLIWDLGRDHLLVHHDPTPEGYATIRVARRGESVAPLAFPDAMLPVSDLLD